MNSWQQAEQNALTHLQTLLPNLTITQMGGHNSQVSDLKIMNSQGAVINAEVKKLPSVAGVQIVVQETTPKTYKTKNIQPFAQLFLQLINDLHQPTNEGTLLTGSHHLEAAKIFATKYEENNTKLLIGVQNSKYTITETTQQQIADKYNLHLLIRKKKSGSSNLSPALKPQAETLLNTHGIATKHTGTKLHLTDPNQRETALEVLKQLENVWVNKTNELRKLSNTNNLTALLSLHSKPETPPTTNPETITIINSLIT